MVFQRPPSAPNVEVELLLDRRRAANSFHVPIYGLANLVLNTPPGYLQLPGKAFFVPNEPGFVFLCSANWHNGLFT
jgi:hypothetical protein